MFEINWQEIKEKYSEAYNKFYNGFIRLGGPEEVCFCDLEKFFDDNGIIISIFYEIEKDMFYYFIYNKNKKENHSNGIFDRISVKIYSIYKAFEILENQLKEGVELLVK